MVNFKMDFTDGINMYYDKEEGYHLVIEQLLPGTYYLQIKDREKNGLDAVCFSCFTTQSLNDYLECAYATYLEEGNFESL